MGWLLRVSLILLCQGSRIKGREGLGSRLLHGLHKSPVSSVRRALTRLQHILGFLLAGFTSCSFLVSDVPVLKWFAQGLSEVACERRAGVWGVVEFKC